MSERLAGEFDAPEGVPISAIIFGGRRARLAPLVYEARDWEHGVYRRRDDGVRDDGRGRPARSAWCAATRWRCGPSADTTWATTSGTGWRWASGRPGFPKIFHVNWFRQNDAGKFLWPGFGENLRVLRWIHGRVNGTAKGRETAIGIFPDAGELDTTGLDVTSSAMEELFAIDRDAWLDDLVDQEQFFASFDGRMPKDIWAEHHKLRSALQG